jgi:hypothetical protein
MLYLQSNFIILERREKACSSSQESYCMSSRRGVENRITILGLEKITAMAPN